jgi:iron complex outermembrane recepter protein
LFSGTRWHSGAESEVKGIEAGVKISPLKWISVFGNITHQDSEVTENKADPTLVGKDLPSTPKLMWNAGFEVSYWKARFVTTVNHVDKTFGRSDNADTADNVPTGQSAYTVTDLDLHLKLTDHVSASFSLDNVFDEDYYLYWKAAGRKYLVSVRYEF